MLNLFDSHTHSDSSPDGTHSVTFMCEKAVENGMMGIAVTDHCDIDRYQEDSYQLRMLQSVFETRKAQLYFSPRLTLTAGIELGQPLFDKECARRALKLQKYDFVLGSVHAPRGGEDYYFQDYTGMGAAQVDRILQAYFEEVLETVQWGGFDVLAHLTYPLRYIDGRDGAPASLAAHWELIREILRTLVRTGKGLELNVAGLYGNYGRTSPERNVLRLYRELGGELVTLGSDAHRAENIGRGIAEGMGILDECGFKYFAFYKDRAPRMLAVR